MRTFAKNAVSRSRRITRHRQNIYESTCKSTTGHEKKLQRALVATGGKDGIVRVLDRETRRVVHEVPVTTMLNEKLVPTPTGDRVCPGILGGVQWNGLAYSPRTDLIYAPAVDWCMTFFGGADRAEWMGPHMGGRVDFGTSDEASGWLSAIDAPTGTIRWRYASDSPMVAPVVATAGGVLFTEDTAGNFLVLDDATGEVVYRFHTGGALSGGIATYALEGRQYVARHFRGNDTVLAAAGRIIHDLHLCATGGSAVAASPLIPWHAGTLYNC